MLFPVPHTSCSIFGDASPLVLCFWSIFSAPLSFRHHFLKSWRKMLSLNLPSSHPKSLIWLPFESGLREVSSALSVRLFMTKLVRGRSHIALAKHMVPHVLNIREQWVMDDWLVWLFAYGSFTYQLDDLGLNSLCFKLLI